MKNTSCPPTVLALYKGLTLEAYYDRIFQSGSLLLIVQRDAEKIVVPFDIELTASEMLARGLPITDAELEAKFVSLGLRLSGANFETVVGIISNADPCLWSLVEEFTEAGFSPELLKPAKVTPRDLAEIDLAPLGNPAELQLCPTFCRTPNGDSIQLSVKHEWDESVDNLSATEFLRVALAAFRLKLISA